MTAWRARIRCTWGRKYASPDADAALRFDGKALPEHNFAMRFFYYNATTPLLPEAKAAWLEASEAHWLNPSSPYRAGAVVHARLEDARERLAGLMGVVPRRIVFNCGATEGNNAVFAAWVRMLGPSDRIAVGVTEHPSVLEAAKYYFKGRIEWLQPDAGGVVRVDEAVLGCVSAVSVMAANNETGILNPWQDWAELCHQRQVPMHCDALQWVGKMPLDGLGTCDYLTACSRKFGGPKGVGFALLPEESGPDLLGGGQERGRRAGTENLAGILAMLAALERVEGKRTSCSGKDKAAFRRKLREALPEVEVPPPAR